MELRQAPIDFAARPNYPHVGPSISAMERHYTVAELSELWCFSQSTIRRLFRKEPGVIKLDRQASKSRQGYTTLRIPASIAQRVLQRLQGIA